MDSTDGLPRPGVVRRFTAELEADCDLAIQTKSYQEDLDAEIEIREKVRMDIVYHNQSPKRSSFTGAELARQTLQSKCDEFFKSLEKKGETGKKEFMGLRFSNRNTTEHQLAQQITHGGEFTVDQVTNITNQVEAKWKESNSKASTNFRKICQTLDCHKQIFQCFPSQNSYTSTLCGAVTMVIQASVNYTGIAEQLSGHVAELSESIAICTRWLDLYSNSEMQERLSAIYTQYFDFFIKVASWYLKPKRKQRLDSFNNNFTEEYTKAAETIKKSIQLISELASIENAQVVSTIVPRLQQSLVSFEDRMRAQAIQSRKESNEVGDKMIHFLQEMTRMMDQAIRVQPPSNQEIEAAIQTETKRIENGEVTEIVELSPGISRAEAERLCQHLQPLIDQVGGSDGINQAIQARRLLAEPAMVHVLGKWAQATSGDSLILWVMSPYETGAQTSAKLGALGVIWTAIQAQAQFVSYICQRPHRGQVSGFSGTENKAGVLAMVYSLIRQLLQFQTPDDGLYLRQEIIDQLTQPEESWSTALMLLKILLENTPTLRYCIISGINLLEGGARDMCQEFVDVLLSHTKNTDWPMRILFTTSGQSRVLAGSVTKESKIMTNNTFRRMKGRMLQPNVPMKE